MSNIPLLSGKRLIKVLEKAGWKTIRIRGSHHILSDGVKIIVVPCHSSKSLPPGTQRALLKDAGIKPDDLIEYIN